MAKKANKAKKAKKAAKAKAAPARKAAKKRRAKKAVARNSSLALSAGHPDKRFPVSGDPAHEILCKWSLAMNEYQCRTVPTGADWS
jgi:hypothetical protein